MPEKKPRVCTECGAEYPADDQTRFCTKPTALGPCRGQVLPKPTPPTKEEP